MWWMPLTRSKTAFAIVVPYAPTPSILGSANDALWTSMQAHKLYDQVNALDASSVPHITKLRVELEGKTEAWAFEDDMWRWTGVDRRQRKI